MINVARCLGFSAEIVKFHRAIFHYYYYYYYFRLVNCYFQSLPPAASNVIVYNSRSVSNNAFTERFIGCFSMRPIFQNTWNSSSVNSCLQDSSSSVVSAVTSTPTARKDYSAVVVKQQQQQQGPSQYNHHHHHHHHQLQQQAANTTTWQQQQFRKQTDNEHRLERTASMKKVTSVPMVVEPSSELFNAAAAAAATNQSEMANIHLKLEEKRKQIENEKRRQEEKLNRQREKLGKAAFLQAISKDAELARKNSWIQRDFYAVTRDALNEIPHLQPQQRTAAMIHRSVGTDGFVQNFSSYPSPQVLYGNDDGFNSYRHQNQQPTTSRPPPQLMTLMYTSPAAGIVNNNNLRQTTTDVNNFCAPRDDLPPEAVSGNLSRALSNKLQIDCENGRHQLQKSSFVAPTRSATSSSPQYFQQQQCHHQQQPSIQKPAVDVIEKGFYICKTDNDDDNRRSPDGGGRSFAKSSVASSGMQTVQRLNNLFHSNIGSSSNTHGDDQFRGSNFLKRSTTGAIGLVIDAGEAKSQADDDEMERKKERILMLSLQRRQQQDEMKVRKEIEAQKKKEKEKEREEAKAKKKEEERKRRNIILTQYRLKKAIEDAERDGVDTSKMNKAAVAIGSSHLIAGSSGRPPAAQLRRKTNAGRFPPRPRPKTIHVSSSRSNVNTPDMSDGSLTPTYAGQKGSSSSLSTTNSYVRRNYYRGSQDCLLAETARTSASSICSDVVDDSCVSSPSKSICGGRKNSYVVGRDFSTAATAGCSPFANRNANINNSNNNNSNNTNNGTKSKNSSQKSNSLVNLSGGSNGDHESTSLQHPDPDSGLGKDDISSQGVLSPNRHHDDSNNNNNNNNNNTKNGGNNLSTSPSSGPGSMMMMVNNGGNNNNNIIRKPRFDDAASESGGSEYSGLRLYKQPTVKSNRGIILNAVEYCVFPGAVNREGKRRVVEEINKSPDIKHFMVLFRDSGCQFRGLYSYNPDSNEEVTKLYGTGPRLVTDRMFDKFFKYNSGGKCFSQVHTKHLTVTIDAFTIHNSLWQGKKVHLPNKKDLSIVV